MLDGLLLSSVTFRHAEFLDAAELAAFASRCFRDTYGADTSEVDLEAYIAQSFSQTIQEREISDPASIFLIARISNEVIAYAHLISTGGDCNIKRFYVDRRLHGTGFASMMMGEVQKASANSHTRRLWLSVWEENHRAIAFYRKCGFVENGRMPFKINTEVQFDIVMEKTIG